MVYSTGRQPMNCRSRAFPNLSGEAMTEQKKSTWQWLSAQMLSDMTASRYLWSLNFSKPEVKPEHKPFKASQICSYNCIEGTTHSRLSQICSFTYWTLSSMFCVTKVKHHAALCWIRYQSYQRLFFTLTLFDILDSLWNFNQKQIKRKQKNLTNTTNLECILSYPQFFSAQGSLVVQNSCEFVIFLVKPHFKLPPLGLHISMTLGPLRAHLQEKRKETSLCPFIIA